MLPFEIHIQHRVIELVGMLPALKKGDDLCNLVRRGANWVHSKTTEQNSGLNRQHGQTENNDNQVGCTQNHGTAMIKEKPMRCV